MDSATTEAVERKIREWKEKLSGVNLRSQLLNFRKEKRSTVEFLVPASEIFQSLTKEISQSSSEEKNVLVVTSIKTQQERKQLLKNLQQLLRDAKATRRQRDMNPLFMALGSLTWTLKSKPDNPITSPIFLIPVELQKTRGKDEYKLIPTTELPIVNSVLIRKLETDHGINLGIEQGDKLWAYCELIEAVQSNKDIAQKVQESGWKILEQT